MTSEPTILPVPAPPVDLQADSKSQASSLVVVRSAFSRVRTHPRIVWSVAAIVVVAVVLAVWQPWRTAGPGAGFVSGNGRIEATEIDVAAKLAGRVQSILVDEGDFVLADQPLARMQTDVLDAQRDEARAQNREAVATVASARAQVVARQSDTKAVQALVAQREAELDIAKRRFERTDELSKDHVSSVKELDDDRVALAAATAALEQARSQLAASHAAVDAADAEVIGAGFKVKATEATIARIEADIQDCELKSPRGGRVQYRIVQPGEVVTAGGKILNLVDLGDVYITFFLPETVVGRVALGAEVHIILDAAPQYVIPATVSYVSSTAQFTPKTVETASERQKLMFRVKAHISRDLLERHLKQVKTGLPGVAWIKLDAAASWPEHLQLKVPQ